MGIPKQCNHRENTTRMVRNCFSKEVLDNHAICSPSSSSSAPSRRVWVHFAFCWLPSPTQQGQLSRGCQGLPSPAHHCWSWSCPLSTESLACSTPQTWVFQGDILPAWADLPSQGTLASPIVWTALPALPRLCREGAALQIAEYPES